MGCVARWSVDVVLYGDPVAMRWGNPGFVVEVGAGVNYSLSRDASLTKFENRDKGEGDQIPFRDAKPFDIVSKWPIKRIGVKLQRRQPTESGKLISFLIHLTN